MHNDKVQQCTFCVLTNEYFNLKFDEKGQCEVCKQALARKNHEWFPNEAGTKKLANILKKLKEQGEHKSYDAMIGLSGGIDSAYLAHLAVKEWGLRVLAVHVDAGWNSNAAVRNIERIVRALDIDLFTSVIEWQEMRDLQLSFLKASVYNQDIPQDHAFFSTLYTVANQFNIPFFLSGVNFSSENIQPPATNPGYIDATHIKAIHKKFGTVKLRNYPLMSISKYIYQTKIIKRPLVIKPLDLINYNKELARSFLKEKYGWTDYGEKHSESRFTKFYQDIYLPRKFNFDKRQLHLSSLIISNQITREECLDILKIPLLSPEQEKRDINFVSKKLAITPQELNTLIDKPVIDHFLFKNKRWIINLWLKLK